MHYTYEKHATKYYLWKRHRDGYTERILSSEESARVRCHSPAVRLGFSLASLGSSNSSIIAYFHPI